MISSIAQVAIKPPKSRRDILLILNISNQIRTSMSNACRTSYRCAPVSQEGFRTEITGRVHFYFDTFGSGEVEMNEKRELHSKNRMVFSQGLSSLRIKAVEVLRMDRF
jgi:hypothetical protein